MSSLELWSSITGSLATIFGGIYWLMKVNYKQQQQINVLKQTIYTKGVQELKAVLEKFEKELVLYKEELVSVTNKSMEAQAVGLRVMKALETYVAQNEARFKKIEETVDRFGTVKLKNGG